MKYKPIIAAAALALAVASVAVVTGASGKAYPHGDGFEVTSKAITLNMNVGFTCSFSGSGTLPEAGSGVPVAEPAFTGCSKPQLAEAVSVKTHGTWEWILRGEGGETKTAEIQIPAGGLEIIFTGSFLDGCVGTSAETYRHVDPFYNGVTPPSAPSVENSASTLQDPGIKMNWAQGCAIESNAELKTASGGNLVWHDTTNPTTKAIVAG